MRPQNFLRFPRGLLLALGFLLAPPSQGALSKKRTYPQLHTMTTLPPKEGFALITDGVVALRFPGSSQGHPLGLPREQQMSICLYPQGYYAPLDTHVQSILPLEHVWGEYTYEWERAPRVSLAHLRVSLQELAHLRHRRYSQELDSSKELGEEADTGFVIWSLIGSGVHVANTLHVGPGPDWGLVSLLVTLGFLGTSQYHQWKWHREEANYFKIFRNLEVITQSLSSLNGSRKRIATHIPLIHSEGHQVLREALLCAHEKDLDAGLSWDPCPHPDDPHIKADLKRSHL